MPCCLLDPKKSKIYSHIWKKQLKSRIHSVSTNVFKIGPNIESEQLPIHNSLVGLMIEPQSNR